MLCVNDTNIIFGATTFKENLIKAKLFSTEISEVFTSLNLALNWDKTHLMSFNNNKSTQDNNTIKFVDEISCLGLLLLVILSGIYIAEVCSTN